GGEAMFARAYRADSQRVRQVGLEVARIEALLDPAKVVLPGLLVAAVVWLGARHVLAGQIGVGQFVAFCGYSVFLAGPMRRVASASPSSPSMRSTAAFSSPTTRRCCFRACSAASWIPPSVPMLPSSSRTPWRQRPPATSWKRCPRV